LHIPESWFTMFQTVARSCSSSSTVFNMAKGLLDGRYVPLIRSISILLS
jgi:hypothetical protein